MEGFTIPALTALKSTDATAIRQIVNSLTIEINKLNKRLDDMEASRKKAQESRKDRHYGV